MFMVSQWIKCSKCLQDRRDAQEMDGFHGTQPPETTVPGWKPYKDRPIPGQECQAQCVISLALPPVQGREWWALVIHGKVKGARGAWSKQETVQGVSWCPDSVFLASMPFASPMAFVVKPVSTFKTEYGWTCFFMSYHHQTLWQKITTSHMPKHAISRNKFYEYTKPTWRSLGSVLLKRSVCQEIWVAMGCWLTFICWGRSADKETSKVPVLCLLMAPGPRNHGHTWAELSAAYDLNTLCDHRSLSPSAVTLLSVEHKLSASCTHMRQVSIYHDVFRQYEVKRTLG